MNIAKCLSTAFYIEYICEYEFLNVMLCYHFPLEAFLQDMAKNNPTEKQIQAEIIKACASMKTDRRKNVKLIVTNCKGKFTS